MSSPDSTEELEDLLPDDLTGPAAPAAPKGAAAPLKRTKKQQAALARRKAAQAKKNELALAQTAAQAHAARLAQIVNLHIGGYSLSDIGAQIGATADEVDRMLATDAARYVRTQPALRVYVRNWISERYMKMIEADWDQATDPNHREKLEHQDRVDRFLRSMAKLHGADAPVQSEVKVEAAPEAVDQLVASLAAGHGLAYDESVFDVVDAEVVHDAVEQTQAATLDAAERAGEDQPGDENWDQPNEKEDE